MKIKTNFGVMKIKAVSLPNIRLIIKRNKGKTNVVIAQRKPLFYLYKDKSKKGKDRIKVQISYNPIYGISKLLNLFQ